MRRSSEPTRAMEGAPGGGGPPALAFPLDYAFKVIGLEGPGFAAHARALVEGAAGVAALRVTERASSGGKYRSVSVVVRLETEARRRAVYQALHADPRVVYYL